MSWIMLTRGAQEGINGEIALPDDDPEIVRLLIEYVYLLDYVPRKRDHSDQGSQGDTDSSSVRT